MGSVDFIFVTMQEPAPDISRIPCGPVVHGLITMSNLITHSDFARDTVYSENWKGGSFEEARAFISSRAWDCCMLAEWNRRATAARMGHH